jgi:hypothetical protein
MDPGTIRLGFKQVTRSHAAYFAFFLTSRVQTGIYPWDPTEIPAKARRAAPVARAPPAPAAGPRVPAQDLDVLSSELVFRSPPHTSLVSATTVLPILPSGALRARAKRALKKRALRLPAGVFELTGPLALQLLTAKLIEKEKKDKKKMATRR